VSGWVGGMEVLEASIGSIPMVSVGGGEEGRGLNYVIFIIFLRFTILTRFHAYRTFDF
jgi:hypothetical protein